MLQIERKQIKYDLNKYLTNNKQRNLSENLRISIYSASNNESFVSY